MRPWFVALLFVVNGCSNNEQPISDSSVPVDEGVKVDALAPPDQSASDAGIDGFGLVAPPPEREFLDGKVGLGGPIVDASPDESGNVWAVAPDALYVRRAGEASFRRYTNADGLHIYSRILAVAGGGDNEGWIGLEGYYTDYPESDPPDLQRVGKAEHVWLNPDGTIRTLHYSDIHNDGDSLHWETRTIQRLLYVHAGPARGHLFMGGNHGVTHVFDDKWGDHVHVEFTWLPENVMHFGLWNGLAVDEATGELWMCGKTACGLMNWNPDPHDWTGSHYQYVLTPFSGDHSIEQAHGYEEDNVGAALGTDGTAYFLSRLYGLAAWKPNGWDFDHVRRITVPGFGDPMDVAADPDGTVWLADSAHLVRYDPTRETFNPFPLPTGDIRRIHVAAHEKPRAVYVSTGAGLFIYRGK